MSARFAVFCALLALLILTAACGEDATPTEAPDTSPKTSDPTVEVTQTAITPIPTTQTPQRIRTARPPTPTPNPTLRTPQPTRTASPPARSNPPPKASIPTVAAQTPTKTPDPTPEAVVPDRTDPTPTVTPVSTPIWSNPFQPGITWVLESVNGNPIIENTSIVLTFYEDSIGGHDGCNSYGFQSATTPHFAPAQSRPDGSFVEGALSVQRIAATIALCPPIEGIEEQTDAYYAALWEGKRFLIRENRLEILDDDEKVTLVFVRQPPLPGLHPDLAGTQWLMTGEMESNIVAFLDDEVVLMVGDCVHYAAGFRINERLFYLYYRLPIHFRMKCSERESMDSLWNAEHYAVSQQKDARTLLIGSRLGETLTLKELPSAPLISETGAWLLESIIVLSSDDTRNNNYIYALTPGSTVTASFQENSVSGSAGCNNFQATLEIDGGAIAIGPASATKKVCDDIEQPNDVMDQESRFLTHLPQVTRGVTIADRLFLSTPTGIYLIFKAQ